MIKRFYFGTDGLGEYNTLSEFLASSPEKEVSITLQKNGTYEDNIEIPEDKYVILNLNGSKIVSKEENSHTIVNKGTLTIDDSTKNGVIDNTFHAHASIFNEGTCILVGGVFTRSKENGKNSSDNGGNSYYTIVNHGDMTIAGDTRITQNGKFSSLIENGWYDGNKNTEKKNSVLIISGGVFNGGINTIKNDDYGVLSINDGIFSNTSQATLLNWNVAHISGGRFTASSDAKYCILNKFQDETMDKGILKISGGTFNGGDITISTDKTDSNIEISGGTFNIKKELFDVTENTKVSVKTTDSTKTIFNKSFNSKYLAEGYVLMENNMKYMVLKSLNE